MLEQEEQEGNGLAGLTVHDNNDDGGHMGSDEQRHNNNSFKGNEDRKIFVGGIAYDVTSEDLTAHFGKFGEVVQSQVKFDRATGRSRGFAFVEFASADICKLALQEREQMIKNKQCEIKPAKSRENKKVFVGGLPADHPEEELRKHFEEFGKVEDIEWPFDKTTKARRNFAFIVFEEEEAADRAASVPKQSFGARECDVKKAVPQNKRAMFGMPGARIPALRGAFGAGMRGGPAGLSMHNAATHWFNGGWPQMPYGGGATGSGAAGWNDWAAGWGAGYYAQPNTNATSFGAFNNGYDYSSVAAAAAAANGMPQPGVRQAQPNGSGAPNSNNGSQRFPHPNQF